MSTPKNSIERARSALAATAVDDLNTAVLYASVARNALVEAKAEIDSLERVLIAREHELVQRSQPPAQLALEDVEPAR